jgi:hypothetical protein
VLLNSIFGNDPGSPTQTVSRDFSREGMHFLMTALFLSGIRSRDDSDRFFGVICDYL